MTATAERPRKGLTVEEKLKRAAESIEALRTTDGWRAWARTRRAFHRYSFRNQLLIAFQNPHASAVAGARRWNDLGWKIRKGEKAAYIYAPVVKRPKAEAPEGEKGAERELAGFRLAPVFGDNQVEPLEGHDQAPMEPPMQPLNGDRMGSSLVLLAMNAEEQLGVDILFADLSGNPANGWWTPDQRSITIGSDRPVDGQYRTLLHELAHVIGDLRYQTSRDQDEIVAEASAWLAAEQLGLDTSGEAFPYLASWMEGLSASHITENAKAVARISDELIALALPAQDAAP